MVCDQPFLNYFCYKMTQKSHLYLIATKSYQLSKMVQFFWPTLYKYQYKLSKFWQVNVKRFAYHVNLWITFTFSSASR